MRPVEPDEKLAQVIGSDPLPRPELTRKLWAYIREHNLRPRKEELHQGG